MGGEGSWPWELDVGSMQPLDNEVSCLQNLLSHFYSKAMIPPSDCTQRRTRVGDVGIAPQHY
jgi:hypothetical protein